MQRRRAGGSRNALAQDGLGVGFAAARPVQVGEVHARLDRRRIDLQRLPVLDERALGITANGVEAAEAHAPFRPVGILHLRRDVLPQSPGEHAER